jgi:hypothetical protein
MEHQIPVRGGTYVLNAIQGTNGKLTPCDVVDSKMNALSTARAIDVFGGASYGQALNRALHEAEVEAKSKGAPWPPVPSAKDAESEAANEGVEIIESPAPAREPAPALATPPNAAPASAPSESPSTDAKDNKREAKRAGATAKTSKSKRADIEKPAKKSAAKTDAKGPSSDEGAS